MATPLAAHAAAQSGTLIDPSRSIDWSNAGVTGGIPNRTTLCATLNPGATAAQINSAIANCPAGQVVYLNAGTYNLSSGITFNNKSNVTLRGAGPDQTFLVFTGSDPCAGLGADICVIGDTSNPVYSGNPVNWTAGYSKGTTQLTLSSTAGLAAGSLIFLDQLDDPDTDTGGIWVCGTGGVCADEGPSGGQRPGRSQEQWVKVTGVDGNTVTISPGIYMPNWRSSQSPQAWWTNNVIKMSGIENLSLDHTNGTGYSGIILFNAYNCWVKNTRSLSPNRNHVWFFTAAANTVRDSYFYGTKNAQSQSYGTEAYVSSDNLVENNIFQHITAPMVVNGGASGSVFAYNYSIDDYYYNPTYMMGQIWLHGAGIDHVLFEGNEGAAFFGDVIHGTHHFVSAFRNYWIGWETGKTDQTLPVALKSFSRYMNIIGNVLGRSGTHTLYQDVAGVGGAGTPIYEIGYGTSNVPNDPLVASTLFRWGNYDTVTGTARFVASEVPSGISQYANPVPSTQTLPASLYLPAKPSWWPASTPWPVIGPDVSNGNISGVGGHANMIPAHLCYNNTAKNSSGILNFNANSCYGGGTSLAPSAPTNLRIR